MTKPLYLTLLICACGPGLEPGDQPQTYKNEAAQIEWVEPVFSSWIAGHERGMQDGHRDEATFGSISAVVALPGHLDRLLVADSINHRIRRVVADRVSLFAGSGPSGLSDPSATTGAFVEGPSLVARFSHPTGVAIDGQGRVYVADSENHRVHRIELGVVKTLAGLAQPGLVDGDREQARFDTPSGIVADPEGRVYLTDSGNHRLRVIEEVGGETRVRTLAGAGAGFADGEAHEARFLRPRGLAIGPEGAIYIADSGNNRIRRVFEGKVETIAGGLRGWRDGTASEARFDTPVDVAADDEGKMAIADSGNGAVRWLADGRVRTIDAALEHPQAVALLPGRRVVVGNAGVRTELRLVTFSDEKLVTGARCGEVSWAPQTSDFAVLTESLHCASRLCFDTTDPYCSARCASDSECPGPTAACPEGFVCGPAVANAGSFLSCCDACVCRRDSERVAKLRTLCANSPGTACAQELPQRTADAPQSTSER